MKGGEAGAGRQLVEGSLTRPVDLGEVVATDGVAPSSPPYYDGVPNVGPPQPPRGGQVHTIERMSKTHV